MTAAVVLAWVAIVLLLFAIAALQRQLRDLQASTVRDLRRDTAPDELLPADGRRYTIVFVADGGCPSCHELVPLLPARVAGLPADIDIAVVAGEVPPSWPEAVEGTRVRLVPSPSVLHRIDPGWRPALILVDVSGRVLAAEPVSSAASLDRLLETFAGQRPAPASATERHAHVAD
jgi:hypothetical protein